MDVGRRGVCDSNDFEKEGLVDSKDRNGNRRWKEKTVQSSNPSRGFCVALNPRWSLSYSHPQKSMISNILSLAASTNTELHMGNLARKVGEEEHSGSGGGAIED
ncbi:uncharacterized protein LOC129323059 [Prosopis cineraria]|uniref:uncharacterized protein LOC129323059 n=1 Tax=Prosopis cineraria TaxID=364024 RepID=UPI0024103FCC|nr:uncharacterized protein LOC129323059 [Prosopis cineraria]